MTRMEKVEFKKIQLEKVEQLSGSLGGAWLKIIEKHCFRGSVALHICNNWIRLFV